MAEAESIDEGDRDLLRHGQLYGCQVPLTPRHFPLRHTPYPDGRHIRRSVKQRILSVGVIRLGRRLFTVQRHVRKVAPQAPSVLIAIRQLRLPIVGSLGIRDLAELANYLTYNRRTEAGDPDVFHEEWNRWDYIYTSLPPTTVNDSSVEGGPPSQSIQGTSPDDSPLLGQHNRGSWN